LRGDVGVEETEMLEQGGEDGGVRGEVEGMIEGEPEVREREELAEGGGALGLY
jgi:hypothetical protein